MHFSVGSTLAILGAVASVQACSGPAVNQATVDLVAEFEGFRASEYIDATGNPTIGYGHKCRSRGCPDVSYPKPLSVADGKRLLSSDLAVAQNCIYLATGNPVHLNANQYGALVSWSFNVGCGNARSSSLIARLNKGEDPRPVIANELPQWNKGGGKVLPGLTRRRKAEVDLANTPTNVGALPHFC